MRKILRAACLLSVLAAPMAVLPALAQTPDTVPTPAAPNAELAREQMREMQAKMKARHEKMQSLHQDMKAKHEEVRALQEGIKAKREEANMLRDEMKAEREKMKTMREETRTENQALRKERQENRAARLKTPPASPTPEAQ